MCSTFRVINPTSTSVPVETDDSELRNSDLPSLAFLSGLLPLKLNKLFKKKPFGLAAKCNVAKMKTGCISHEKNFEEICDFIASLEQI